MLYSPKRYVYLEVSLDNGTSFCSKNVLWPGTARNKWKLVTEGSLKLIVTNLQRSTFQIALQHCKKAYRSLKE